jgi:hypothetical protein
MTSAPDAIILPRAAAVRSTADPARQTRRYRHIQPIAEKNRIDWQRASEYDKRNHIRNTIGRYKHLIGPKFFFRALIDHN